MKKVCQALLAFLFLFNAWIPYTFAKEPKTPEMTLEKAVQLALRYSKSIERSVLDVTYAEDMREDTGLALALFNPNWATQYTPGVEGFYAAYLSADYGYESAAKKRALQEDLVIGDVYNKYYGLLQVKKKVDAAKAALSAEENRYKVAQARFQVGMLSRIDLDKAQAQLEKVRADLIAAESEIENAYVAFNQLVGLDPEDRPVLVDSPPSFAALEVADLTATVEGIVSNSPMQWIMDEGADLQERLAGLTGSSEKGKIKAEQARLDAEKNRDDTRSRVYNTYYTLKQLEDSYSTVQRQMRLAEDSLKLSQLSYELGLVTRADVLSAQAALAQARAALFELTCRHALLKIAFYKPWVAGVVMSSGTGSAGGGSTQSSGSNSAGF